MGRTDDLQEYEHDQHGVETVDHENHPTEMVINYNIDQQASYNASNQMEPQTNNVEEQYQPPYPPPQQPPQMGTPPVLNYPPGSPMQYPPARSPQPMQFQPAYQAHLSYNGPTAQYERPEYSSYRPPSAANNLASGVPMAHVGTEPWRSGLFDCMGDPQSAIITACFPCMTFGQIAEIIDNGHTTCATSGLMYGCISALIGVPCILLCGYRTKLRSRFGLMETPASDWVTHCLCEWCALCQAYRELNLRGLDPSIGWQGNLARSNMQQQQPMGMMPPRNQTMNY